MSDALQKNLLRVLEDDQVRPLGAKDSVHVDVIIVCAAKERLEDLVQGGRFRQDLYFRLKGVVLEVAPLRERPEDILPLAEHFLDVHSSQAAGVRPELSRDAKLVLLKHAWSGNVRELENEMRRLVALRGEVVRREDLELSTEAPPFSFSLQPGSVSLSEVVNLAEKEAILEALRQAGGNKSRAATQLGITRKALYRRLAKYGISK
jgi:Nif-specific regulatory protein